MIKFIPEDLQDNKVEFFVMNGVLQFINGGELHLFEEITIDIAGRLRQELDQDPAALRGLEILNITDPFEQLRQYAFCRYGDLNRIIDIDLKGESIPEYWDCGKRPCAADGFLCKYPKVPNGKLTKNEAELLREISSDVPNKIIAGHRNVTLNTINKECKNLQEKVGCFTKIGLARFAGQNNLF